MFLIKEKIFESKLSVDDCISNIKGITRKSSLSNIFNENEFYKFEGSIENENFKIYPIFSYGLNKFLRPKIIGNIIKSNEKTTVKLNFTLPNTLSLIFLIGLIVNIFLIITSDGHNTILHFSFLIGAFLIFKYYLEYKINRSLDIFKNLLHKPIRE